jgi:hypothetical protein
LNEVNGILRVEYFQQFQLHNQQRVTFEFVRSQARDVESEQQTSSPNKT